MNSKEKEIAFRDDRAQKRSQLAQAAMPARSVSKCSVDRDGELRKANLAIGRRPRLNRKFVTTLKCSANVVATRAASNSLSLDGK